MELRYKVWLEQNGELTLGDGLYQLLRGISARGSISQAASAMRLSYREAWGRIRTAERRLGVSLLMTQVGGEEGGGTQLTPAALQLLEKYQRFREELDAAIQGVYRKHIDF
ncbi:MAG: LysR family transcriptional regulator [Firmicutes bacterium]|nr:LysR family transcriptional regulator [Bacillota bacterium]MCL5040007.1 LysR family transcriptional regulator [Bacillota bacterium]